MKIACDLRYLKLFEAKSSIQWSFIYCFIIKAAKIFSKKPYKSWKEEMERNESKVLRENNNFESVSKNFWKQFTAAVWHQCKQTTGCFGAITFFQNWNILPMRLWSDIFILRSSCKLFRNQSVIFALRRFISVLQFVLQAFVR